MLISEIAKYNLSEADQQCKVALNKYPNVLVRIPEIRNENELHALKNILVSKSLKESVYLNAHRQCKLSIFKVITLCVSQPICAFIKVHYVM